MAIGIGQYGDLTGFLTCLSTDTKPVGAAIGSLAYETDTGNWFIRNSAGSWVAFNGFPSGGAPASAEQVVGNVAAGAADSGNPVKVGGKYNATLPTLTDGNRGDLQLDVNAMARVALPKTLRLRATLNGSSPGTIAAAGDYAAGDVLNNSTSAGTFWLHTGIARYAGAGGWIDKSVVTFSVAALVPRLRRHLFNADPTVIQNDNVALLLDADDRAAYLGPMDYEPLQTSGSSEISWATCNTPFRFCTNADANLRSVFQTLDAFTNESANMTQDVHDTVTRD